VLDAKGSFSGNTYIQRSKEITGKEEESTQNNQTTNSSGVFGSLHRDLSPSNMLLHPNCVNVDTEKYQTNPQPNLKKLMFRKAMHTKSLLQFHGKLVLRDLNQEKAKPENKEFRFVPSKPKNSMEVEGHTKEMTTI